MFQQIFQGRGRDRSRGRGRVGLGLEFGVDFGFEVGIRVRLVEFSIALLTQGSDKLCSALPKTIYPPDKIHNN